MSTTVISFAEAAQNEPDNTHPAFDQNDGLEEMFAEPALKALEPAKLTTVSLARKDYDDTIPVDVLKGDSAFSVVCTFNVLGNQTGQITGLVSFSQAGLLKEGVTDHLHQIGTHKATGLPVLKMYEP